MAALNSNCTAHECINLIGRSGAKGFCPFHYRRFRATGDPLVSADDLARRHRPCPSCGVSYSPGNSLSKSCKPCRKKAMVEYNRKWREDNPEYHSEYNRKWREDNPEAYLEYSAKYRVENREAVRASYAAWEAKNPRHAQEWAERNPERARETVRRRRARLRNVPTFEVTEKDIRRLLSRHGRRCAYCSEVLGDSYHMDHVVPVSVGGSNGIGNLVPACASCNVSKSNWFLSEWRYRERLTSPLKRRQATFERVA